MEAYNRNATPINQITSTAKANAKATISFNANTTNNKNHNNTASTNNICSSGSVVFENGTIMGAVYDYNTSYGSSNCSSSSGSSSCSSNNSNNNSISSHRNSSDYQQPEGQFASIPEIVINGSYNSHQNLHHQQQQQQQQQKQYQQTEAHTGDSSSNCDDAAIESTALLSSTDNNTNSNSNAYATTMNGVVDLDSVEASDAVVNDEFEQFLLNRSTSDSNILESSIYSELQFPPSIGSLSIGGGVGATAYVGGVGGVGGAAAGGGYMGSSMAQQCQLAAARAQLQLPPLPAMSASNAAVNATNTNNNNNANNNVAELADLLNTSTCSRDSSSRASKRSRTRKSHKSSSKAKWNANVAAANAAQGAATAAAAAAATYPPQYAAIFLDHGNMTAAANAMGQIASAAAAGSPFLNAPFVDAAAAAAYLQQQPYQLITTATAPYAHLGRHLHHRRFLDTPTAVVDNPAGVIVGAATGGVGVGAGPAANSTMVGGAATAVSSTFRKCFSRPIVPFIIGIFALGGAACTLGGVVLGATGLIEHTTQYLSASLLMIGIGLSLLIVAGIIWRLCTPSDADECPCYRLMETCRNCNSPYCNNRILPGGYLYPEFQHRPPPPSYLTSLHECAAIGLINGAVYSGLRMNTPPPLYRSTNSLSVFVPGSNSNTHTLTTNTPTTTFTPTTVMPNNNNNNQPPQSGPPNYVPPVALPNATTAATEQLLAEQAALIENLQTQAATQQQMQTQQALQQPTLTKEINYLELD